MKELVILQGAEPRTVLETVIKKKVPAIVSYLSRGKWYIVKTVICDMGRDRIKISVSPRKLPYPMNIRVEQPVGISIKYEDGKFVFDSKVVDFEQSCQDHSGGVVVLEIPDRIELVERRSFFRISVPRGLKVNVMIWHRNISESELPTLPKGYWQGQLVDISAGGGQVSIKQSDKPDFRAGQFVCLRFTPMPYETPLVFNAQVRTILPAADNQNICIGLRIVGLEASAGGRRTLERLVNVVEHYYEMNKSSAKDL